MKYRITKFVLFAVAILTVLTVSCMTGCAGSAKNHAEDYINQGLVLASQGKYAEAIAAYNKAIELDPNNALAYNYRGEAYKSNGKYDLALADFNKAIELDPKDQRAYANRVAVEQLIALANIQHNLTTTTTTATATNATTATGEWPTFSDENKIVIYQQSITGNINDDNGSRTYHVNPTILRACGGKPNDSQKTVYKWSASSSLPAGIHMTLCFSLGISVAKRHTGAQKF